MSDAMEEATDQGDWLDAFHATFGNKRNSFAEAGKSLICDYIFYRSNGDRDVEVSRKLASTY